MDRRFGENDPTMTPEEKAAERFARESQRRLRKESMFNLEDEADDQVQLTHKGQALSFDNEELHDDFEDDDLEASSDDGSGSESGRKRKREVRFADEDGVEDADEEEEEGQPERKKSKAEVMKEIIAKSKFYRYERQKAREEDAELRTQLDKGLGDLFEVMRTAQPPSQPEPPKEGKMDTGGATSSQTQDRSQVDKDKEYDMRLKLMAFDKRSKPTDRTKTEEEKAKEEAERLKQLEAERLRRMKGEDVEESEAEESQGEADDESVPDDAKAFGLSQPDPRKDMGVEDEDEFIIDEDLVDLESHSTASLIGSDDDEMDDEEGEDEDEEEDKEPEEDDHDEMAKDLAKSLETTKPEGSENLAYTYPCPESHKEFVKILKGVANDDVHVVVQRIRALHHPRLHPDNKAKLGRFSAILVEHVAYLAKQADHPPFSVLEALLRHIHSMAKSNSEPVAKAFRAHLREVANERPLNLQPCDLIILTGIGMIFPTSDHFHPVVTPANLCIARYLGQSTVTNVSDLVTGTYAASLAIQYQTLAKRYMPEFINYCLNALVMLAPTKITANLGALLVREPEQSVRLSTKKRTNKTSSPRKLRLWDAQSRDDLSAEEAEELKLSLVQTIVSLLSRAADLWREKTAFQELIQPAIPILQHLLSANILTDTIKPILTQLQDLSAASQKARRPLLLHYHRPLAIKTAIPKFEDEFNPDRHYDPNRERAVVNRLKAEYKRERKGVMRELRKDANFIAREALREKKERDAEYERKFRKLVAEIQSEEGREKNAYEREKRLRQGKR